MKAIKSTISGALAMIMIVTAFVVVSSAADDKVTTLEERAVTYKIIGIGDYQNFLMNWDNAKQAVLYALVQTPGQYNALFHAAAMMGAKRPFAPDAELYKEEQILVVARVTAAPGDREKVFEVERVIERDQALVLFYRFNEPKAKATWSGKNWLAVRIPRHNYNKVIFVENEKRVGELKTAEGQWSVPDMTRKPNT